MALLSAFTSDLCPAASISESFGSTFGGENKPGDPPLAKTCSCSALPVQTVPAGEGDTPALLTVKVSHVIPAVPGFVGNKENLTVFMTLHVKQFYS